MKPTQQIETGERSYISAAIDLVRDADRLHRERSLGGLYRHYTSGKGAKGILAKMRIEPSAGGDAGSGVYLTRYLTPLSPNEGLQQIYQMISKLPPYEFESIRAFFDVKLETDLMPTPNRRTRWIEYVADVKQYPNGIDLKTSPFLTGEFYGFCDK